MISTGVISKPSYCKKFCQFSKTGAGFCPDWVPENPKIAVLLEAPGENEILEREPLVGKAGKLWTRRLIERLGYHREDVLIANTLRCRPPDNVYPTGNLRIHAEKSCRNWDSGLIAYNPTIFLISYHPSFLLRVPAMIKLTRRTMELAFQMGEAGERPLVLMGDKAMELAAPHLAGKGGLKTWNRHWWRVSGWPFKGYKTENEKVSWP